MEPILEPNLLQRMKNLEKEKAQMSNEIITHKRMISSLEQDLKVLYDAVGLPFPTHSDATPSNADLPVVNTVGDADTTAVMSSSQNGSQQGQDASATVAHVNIDSGQSSTSPQLGQGTQHASVVPTISDAGTGTFPPLRVSQLGHGFGSPLHDNDSDVSMDTSGEVEGVDLGVVGRLKTDASAGGVDAHAFGAFDVNHWNALNVANAQLGGPTTKSTVHTRRAAKRAKKPY